MMSEEPTGVMLEVSAALVASNSTNIGTDTGITTTALEVMQPLEIGPAIRAAEITSVMNLVESAAGISDDYIDALLYGVGTSTTTTIANTPPASATAMLEGLRQLRNPLLVPEPWPYPIHSDFRNEPFSIRYGYDTSLHAPPTGPVMIMDELSDEIFDAPISQGDKVMSRPTWGNKVIDELNYEQYVKKEAARVRLRDRMQTWEIRPRNRLMVSAASRTYFRTFQKNFKALGVFIGKNIGLAAKHKAGNWDQWFQAARSVATLITSVHGQYQLPSNFSAVKLWSKVKEHDVERNNVFEEFYSCSHCGAIHHMDDFMNDDSDNLICDVCQQSGNYRYSRPMNVWIHRNRAISYYPSQRSYDNGDPQYVTSRWATDNNLYWDERNEVYVGEGVETDGEDEEEEASPSIALRDYHHSPRRFHVHQKNPNALYKNMPPLGLELELWSPDRGSTVHNFKNDFEMIGDLLMERDGSLSSAHGMELITDPLGYEEWQQIGPALCKQALKTECVAYNHPDTDNNYGIHLTMARKYLSPLQEVRLFMLMAARENLEFIRTVAQRNGIYGPQVDLGGLTKIQQKIYVIGGIDRCNDQGQGGKKILGRGKYAPINFKGNLAEVRIFQSTLHTESFMKNIEFIWAIVEWVRGTTGRSWHHEDFIKWFANRGKARADYPNLWAYLQRPSYRVKKYGYAIVNTWRHHFPSMPNPVRGAAPVVLTEANDQLLAA